MTTSSSNPAAPQPYRVMIVDDSATIRRLLKHFLTGQSGITVVHEAENGQQAIDYLKQHKDAVDVITLDVEMPIKGGLEALPEILKHAPNSRVIMVSTLTKKDAEPTVKALSLGASDYMPKPSAGEGDLSTDAFIKELTEKIKILGSSARVKAMQGQQKTSLLSAPFTLAKSAAAQSAMVPDVFAIGSSTGGPQALSSFFQALKGKTLSIPIVLTQHMPKEFTRLLAEQLGRISNLPAKEGVHGEKLLAGRVYVAPGDFHMVFERKGLDVLIKLNQDPPENFCRPAVDTMLRSLADVYGGKVLTMILTGMGSDGVKGAKTLTDKGGVVIAQDEATSVVWGMPGAVAKAGICSAVMPLNQLPEQIVKLSKGRIG